MNYSDILQYFNTKSMKQDEMIDSITNEMYSNNYTFMEQIIEEYVLGLNDKELNTLEKFINNISNTYEWMVDRALNLG